MTPLAKLRAALATHEAKRPDHLAATHPKAPPHLHQKWVEWCRRKDELTTQIQIEERAESGGWRDPMTGQRVKGVVWKGGMTNVHDIRNAAQRKRDAA